LAARGIYHAINTPLPSRFEINPGQVGKNVKPVGIVTETEEIPRVGEVLRL